MEKRQKEMGGIGGRWEEEERDERKKREMGGRRGRWEEEEGNGTEEG